MVVVMIIGIISAISIPNLIVAIERSRQRRTMVDMRNMATAWEARNVEANRYNAGGIQVPGIQEQLDTTLLATALSPTYIKVFPRLDGWAHPFECFTNQPWGNAQSAQVYAIISPGRDGRFTPDPQMGALTNFDCDIVYSNGAFLAYPEGASTTR
jgi:type II secretory pathway pseudopilin PulG